VAGDVEALLLALLIGHRRPSSSAGTAGARLDVLHALI
jgi:hypothetical protein